MLAKVLSGTTYGLTGVQIEVEVDVANRGLPSFTIVGLPDKTVDESKDRVRTAIVNSGFQMPEARITVNLAPADIPKGGAAFDLPIAIGIMTAAGMIEPSALKNALFVGELSLEGKLRTVPGVISIAIMAQEKQFETIFLPSENASEAALFAGLTVIPVTTLSDLVLHLNQQKLLIPYPQISFTELLSKAVFATDFAEVRAQKQAKRALEIAAAGFHNIHLKGVPGAGKTMLSRAFPSIMPPLSQSEMIEVTKIYSVAGLLQQEKFITRRPFRSPHHTTSRHGIIGGGTNIMPGEISLAHRGVLFLDEMPEFPRSVLESLRQPLEDGEVTISRASGTLTFPSRFILLAASNPCPCGFLGHPTKPCKCAATAIVKYQKRLSGPLLDRIDLHITVPPVEHQTLLSTQQNEESSETVRQRVVAAQQKQHSRFEKKKIKFNSEMTTADIKKLCEIASDAKDMLTQAATRLQLSARSYFKTVKVAQTIADLENKPIIDIACIAEALQYRLQEE